MASTESVSFLNVEVLAKQSGSLQISALPVEVLFQQFNETMYASSFSVEVLFQVPWPHRFGPVVQTET